MSIFTPVNQKLLTNVSYVRYKRGGKRFEIACYPNKVQSWRKGIEKDLSEVLQVERVFTNVSKGVLAKKEDLLHCFETDDERKVLMMILEKGEVQVSEKERQMLLDSTFKDIASVVAEKCLNPDTKRPLTVGIVERAMRDIHYNVHPTKSAKQQALEVIKLLQGKILIQRSFMRLKINLPAVSPPAELSTSSSSISAESSTTHSETSSTEFSESPAPPPVPTPAPAPSSSSSSSRRVKEGHKEALDKLRPLIAKVEAEEAGEHGVLSLVVLVDPGAYRTIDDVVRNVSKGKGNIEVLSLAVTED